MKLYHTLNNNVENEIKEDVPNIDIIKPNDYDSIDCIIVYLSFLKKYRIIVKYVQ